MDRRRFVAWIGSALAAPHARAQQTRRPFRVAHVSINSLATRKHLNDALELGLRERGYTIGQDLLMEQAAGDGTLERLRELVHETVARGPDVIVTGANVVTLEVRAATQRIPIVTAIGANVIGVGLAKSLAHPGGNVTGMTADVDAGVLVKQVELLKEMLPRSSRVGALWEQGFDSYKPALDKAAATLGLSMPWVKFTGDLARDFSELQGLRCDALLLVAGTTMYRRSADVGALALRHRLPIVSGFSEFVTAGGLMSYGPNLADLYRRAARYVHQILRGAAPGELPFEQPARFDLELNLKSAKILGVAVPPAFLVRADRVIE